MNKCNLCNKEDDGVKHYTGGCIAYAHADCAEIAERAIQLYVEWRKIVNKIKRARRDAKRQ